MGKFSFEGAIPVVKMVRYFIIDSAEVAAINPALKRSDLSTYFSQILRQISRK